MGRCGCGCGCGGGYGYGYGRGWREAINQCRAYVCMYVCMYDDRTMTSGFEMYYDLIDHRLTVGPQQKKASNLQKQKRTIHPSLFLSTPTIPDPRRDHAAPRSSVSSRSYRCFVLFCFSGSGYVLVIGTLLRGVTWFIS